MASGIAAERGAVRAGRQTLRRVLGREHGAHGKAAAQSLGNRHDIGRDAGPLVCEQLARAAHAGLDFVEHQQQTVLVAEVAQASEALGWTVRTPPSPWIGSIMMAAVSGPIAASTAS